MTKELVEVVQAEVTLRYDTASLEDRLLGRECAKRSHDETFDADLLKEAREALINARLSAEAAIVAWQPIETAPKDGTWVDLWKVAPDGIHGGRIAECKWDNNRSFNGGIGRVAQPDAWVGRGGTEVWLDGGYFSHWMPLPSPPADAIEQGKHRHG